jgi:hypothetical protein
MDDRQAPAESKTPTVGIRLPRLMWDAYNRVCGRLGRDRTEDIADHIRGRIREHGDDRDLADLEAAEQELAERRSRKGGRPSKSAGRAVRLDAPTDAGRTQTATEPR